MYILAWAASSALLACKAMLADASLLAPYCSTFFFKKKHGKKDKP
jgi:hypothetical protein